MSMVDGLDEDLSNGGLAPESVHVLYEDVDLRIPGCPTRPATILTALQELREGTDKTEPA